MEKLSAQERIIALVELLYKRHYEGTSNKEAAVEIKTSEVNICRDLGLLEKHGWTEKTAKDGRWRLAPGFGKISEGIMKSFRTARLRLTEEEARYVAAMQ